MSSYEFLAGCYDELTYDVAYAAWADYIQRHFRRGIPGKTILDLACGTGSLTRELALRGYEMIGVDLSPEMLAEAAEKNRAHLAPAAVCPGGVRRRPTFGAAAPAGGGSAALFRGKAAAGRPAVPLAPVGRAGVGLYPSPGAAAGRDP